MYTTIKIFEYILIRTGRLAINAKINYVVACKHIISVSTLFITILPLGQELLLYNNYYYSYNELNYSYTFQLSGAPLLQTTAATSIIITSLKLMINNNYY